MKTDLKYKMFQRFKRHIYTASNFTPDLEGFVSAHIIQWVIVNSKIYFFVKFYNFRLIDIVDNMCIGIYAKWDSSWEKGNGKKCLAEQQKDVMVRTFY